MKNRLLSALYALTAIAHANSTYRLETLDLPDASAIRVIYHVKKPENMGLARAVSLMELFEYSKNESPLSSKDPSTIADIMLLLANMPVIDKIAYPPEETDQPELPTPCQVSNSAIVALEQTNGEWLFLADTCMQQGFYDTTSWRPTAISQQLTTYHTGEWQTVILSVQEKLRRSP